MIKTEENTITTSTKKNQYFTILDNIDRKYSIDKTQYILLLKKQKEKEYSTLYLTDCENTFWLKKIDLKFINRLILELNLDVGTELSNFIKCLIVGITNKSKVNYNSIEKEMILSVELQIGEGLVLNSVINFDTKISSEDEENAHTFKMILKLFFKQLYESKESQQKMYQQQIKDIQEKHQKQKNTHNIDPGFIKEVLGKGKKNAVDNVQSQQNPVANFKNRSLLNPNQKKRKNLGVKLGSGYE